jgi:hypothetical protein
MLRGHSKKKQAKEKQKPSQQALLYALATRALSHLR